MASRTAALWCDGTLGLLSHLTNLFEDCRKGCKIKRDSLEPVKRD